MCLSVRGHKLISGTAGPIFTKCVWQIPCGRGPVLLWQRSDTLCTSGFMDDVTFGCNGLCGNAWLAALRYRGRVSCFWWFCFSKVKLHFSKVQLTFNDQTASTEQSTGRYCRVFSGLYNFFFSNKAFIDIRLRPGITTPLATHRHTAHYTLNVTSSIKPEVHNVSQRCHRRTEPRHGHRGSARQISWRSVQRFQRYVRRQTEWQTHRQTDKLIAILRSPYRNGVIM